MVAINIGETFVVVRADTSRFAAEATAGTALAGDAAGQSFATRFATRAGALGTTMTKFVTLPIAAGLGFATKAASDLNEQITKSEAVFRSATPEVMKFASQGAQSLGMSKRAALEAAGTFGNLFTAMGIGVKPAADMSIGLTQLAVDLASFNNADPTEVFEALRSGLVGEVEPMRRFGVQLSQVRIEAKALELGLWNGIEPIDANAKAQAAYAIILEDTQRAQGDFERTSDGVANKSRIAKAAFEDSAATLGTKLLPVAQKLIGVFTDIVSGFSKLPDGAQNIVLIGAVAAAAAGPLLKLASLAVQTGQAVGGLGTHAATFGSFVGGGGFAGNVAKGGLALGGFLIAAQLIGPKLTEMTGSAEVAGGALGAITGATFGPWGAVVGGVLGAVAGHFGLLGDEAATSQEKAKAAVDRLTEALLRQDGVISEMSVKQLTDDFKAAGDVAEEAVTKLFQEGIGEDRAKVLDPIIAKFREIGLEADHARSAAITFSDSTVDVSALSVAALTKMNVTYEDLNRSLQGGPVVIDEWVASQVEAAIASGATAEQAAALGLTLEGLAPKWSAVNAEMIRDAEVSNNAAFFVNQFANNLGALGTNLDANAAKFAYTGTITGMAAEQFKNAGIAAVATGKQLTEEGVAVEYVNGVMATQSQQLVDQVNQITGGNIPATAAHTAELLNIPPERFTNVHTTADIARIVAQHFIDTVNRTPSRKDVPFAAHTDEATRTVNRWIDSLPREHRIRVIADMAPKAFGRQHGGPLPAGQVSWVGEAGRELAVFGQGGRILPHGESERLAREALALNRTQGTAVAQASPVSREIHHHYSIVVNALQADLDERRLFEVFRRFEMLHG